MGWRDSDSEEEELEEELAIAEGLATLSRDGLLGFGDASTDLRGVSRLSRR